MRLTRPIAAASLLAVAMMLASCSSSNDVTATPTTDPSFAARPLDFIVNPTVPTFFYTGGPILPASQFLRFTGNISLASYPFLGPRVYTPTGVQPWLLLPAAPTFVNGGWQFEMRTNPVGLADGVYTARVPITMPGATNSPGSITVTLTVCTSASSNCLFNGSTVSGEFTNLDPQWSRSTTLNNDPESGFPYDDYALFVPPFTTLWVHVLGSCSGVGTLFDPYQYAFTSDPAHTYVNSDDDGFGCVFDSKMSVTNSTGATKQYLLRETVYSAGYRGTYVIYVRDHQLFPGGGFTLRAQDDETDRLIAEKQLLKAKGQN